MCSNMQTGTGKTHTMEGDLSNQDHHGVIPRAARAIFDTLRSAEYSNAHVSCSYLEIYNEELGDLLSDGNNKVTMMEGKGGIVCRGLSEESVGSAEDVLNLMHKAQDKRHIGETKMNKSSSRSHCIFTIRVSAAVQVADGTVTLEGKLHMVDLAGSESAKTASLGDKTTGVSFDVAEHILFYGAKIFLPNVFVLVKMCSTRFDSCAIVILQFICFDRTKLLVRQNERISTIVCSRWVELFPSSRIKVRGRSRPNTLVSPIAIVS